MAVLATMRFTRWYLSQDEDRRENCSDNNRGICQIKCWPMRELNPIDDLPCQRAGCSKNSVDEVAANSPSDESGGEKPEAMSELLGANQNERPSGDREGGQKCCPIRGKTKCRPRVIKEMQREEVS